MNRYAEEIIRSRTDLKMREPNPKRSDEAAEGGCGVLGFAANLPLPGRHVLAASRQMHNRGNGKGGGIAMVGLDSAQARVDPSVLRSHYMLQIALLDPSARSELEHEYITSNFEITQAYELPHIDDYRVISGLEVRPPDVLRYFVRVKPAVLEMFATKRNLQDLPGRMLEDEFVYQNSYLLNRQFYASLGEQRAFVLSHGRNLSVLKIVGYAEDVVEYYQLEDQQAHIWIAHQRYPTKGRVWHPGGAHPFIGLNEALVHNGDFANYHAVSEYLRQRNIEQLFLTDTEVSVQLFDLWDRVYAYPLEVILEALAPTTEYDFSMLPDEKQRLYQAVQRTHIHGSPDGPWFFILARSLPGEDQVKTHDQSMLYTDTYELLGITDTSMLRPQVFALFENHDTIEPGQSVQIGLIASERQAINACLRSLAESDLRFRPVADQYWVARGGSHTDGGAFRFQVSMPVSGSPSLVCTNKFGGIIHLPTDKHHYRKDLLCNEEASLSFQANWENYALHAYDDGGSPTFWSWLQPTMAQITWNEFAWGLNWLNNFGSNGDGEWMFSLETLNLLRDRRYNSGDKKRSSMLTQVDNTLVKLFNRIPLFIEVHSGPNSLAKCNFRRLDWDTRLHLASPDNGQRRLLIDALGFPAEGDHSVAAWLVRAAESGWKSLIAYNLNGGRFCACGLGANSDSLRIDLYGDVGDYAASGLDGAEVHLHGDAQDQIGQIIKRGKLVIYGDAGQTFMYGAKGGEVYIFGSLAGRPLINAVGRPRAVINGTCLDYLAESFMAGDPLQGGGFVILNGVRIDGAGRLRELETPYPGGNLFSLASGGAIYIRDPHKHVAPEQLNGGTLVSISEEDWRLIEPCLVENERLFGIQLNDLLAVNGKVRSPIDVYRKVTVSGSGILVDDTSR